MDTITSAGLARVVIVAPSRRFAVALPERVTLASLLPGLVRQAGESGEAAQPPPPQQPSPQIPTQVAAPQAAAMWSLSGWVLRRIDGTPLDPSHTLAAQEVRDGEILHLMPREADWPEVEYDDVVEAIAAGSRTYGTAWQPTATRRAGLAAAAVSLLVALAAIMRSGPPWPVASAIALTIGVVLLLAGTLLARAGGDSMAGAVFAALGLPYVFVGGLLVLADDQLALTELGAPHALVAGVATMVAAVLGHAGVRDGDGLLLGGVVCGAAAAAGATAGLTALDGSQSAAVVLALLVLTHPLLAWLAVKVSKVPLPALPRTVNDLIRDDARPSDATVIAAAARGSQILFGLVLGVSVASAFCLVIAASAGGLAAPLLAAVASLALLLRARAWRTVQLRLPMLLAGGLGAVLCVLGLASRATGTSALAATVGVLLLTAVTLAGVGLFFGNRPPSPRLARFADIVDVIAVLSVVPIAAGALGLYDSMLGLREMM